MQGAIQVLGFYIFLPLSYNIQFTYEHYAIKKQILFQLVVHPYCSA